MSCHSCGVRGVRLVMCSINGRLQGFEGKLLKRCVGVEILHCEVYYIFLGIILLSKEYLNSAWLVMIFNGIAPG